MAISSEGEVLWSKVLDNGASGYDHLTNAFIDSEDKILVSGKTNGAFPGYENSIGTNVFFAKFTLSGETEWIKQFNVTGDNMQVNEIGEFYFKSGQRFIKFDSGLENIIWNKEITISDPANGFYDLRDFTLDSDGNVLILYNEYSWLEWEENGQYYSDDDVSIVVAKFNQEAELLWLKNYGSDKYDYPEEIEINSNGEIYITGGTNGNLDNNIKKLPYLSQYQNSVSDIFLTKLDTEGNILNTKQFGTINEDWALSLSININNDIYISGIVRESLDGNTYLGQRDIFIMKVPY